MAKQRKSKNEDTAKPESTEAVVRHQKLCLSIDMENRRIYGFDSLAVLSILFSTLSLCAFLLCLF